MKVILYDGSILECSTIYFEGNNIICDDYRIVPLMEVLRIEEATA